MVIQPDGKIVAAGRTPNEFTLARYNTDGSLDTTFGTGGRVTTSFGSSYAEATSLLQQADGKLIAFGLTTGPYGSALARYNEDGSLDTGFGSAGKVTSLPGLGYYAEAALQPDGKIVTAGYSNGVALRRYNPDGSLDPSFGTGGLVITQVMGGAEALAVVVQPDGKIVTASGQFSSGSFLLARYNPSGGLDASFGIDGLVTTAFPGFGNEAWCLVLQPDGKLVAAGFETTRRDASGPLCRRCGTGHHATDHHNPAGSRGQRDKPQRGIHRVQRHGDRRHRSESKPGLHISLGRPLPDRNHARRV